MKYPYRITTSYDWDHDSSGIIHQQMRSWLYDNVGPAYEYWRSELYDEKLAINFVRKKDALLFALRWS